MVGLEVGVFLLSESRIIADFGDWKMLTAGAVSACLSESQISRITLTQKSVTSGNPPSKQIWFIAIPTAVLALQRCPPVVLRYVSAQSLQCLNISHETKL